MIVKQVLSEELLTLAEVKETLNREKKDAEELKYEKRRALEHANKFARTDGKSAREIMNELLKLSKVKAETAVRIADLMPQTRDELRAIYAKERFTLSDTEFDKIIEIVKRYL